MEPGARLALELDQQQGAALITKHATYREDIERRLTFEKYIKKHYDSWVDFAREHGHDSNPKPVLVTGVDLTREFAMVAYSNNSVRLEYEFTAAVPVASASLSLWGAWRTEGIVHTNRGPRSLAAESVPSNPGDPITPGSAIPSEHNQCAFIRYYTIRKRGFIPKLIKAGAGPQNTGRDSRQDPESDIAVSVCLQDSPGGNNRDAMAGDSPEPVPVTPVTPDSDVVVHNLSLVRLALLISSCSNSTAIGRCRRF